MDYEAFMQLPEEDRQQAQELRESEKKTKELNFTLARKLNTEKPPEDPLELLHKMMTER